MQAILLCAGSSSRMQPIGDKVLLSFCGKTLLEHQIEQISSSGIDDIILVVNNENKSAIEVIVKKYQEIHIQITEQKNLEDGMKGAIEACKSFVKKSVLVINSNDIVEKILLEQMIEKSQNTEIQALICGKVVDNYFPGGYLSVEGNRLTGIIEKPGEGNEPSNLVNLVYHYFQDFQDFTKYVEKNENSTDDAYEKALQNLCEEQCVEVLKYDGYWQAIKYPWHVLDVQEFFMKEKGNYIHKNTDIAKTAVIKGDVYIDEGVKVFDTAVIVGPCYIGKNTVIANNTLVRESHIGENCVIGFSTEVARSYLEKDIWTHSNYIGDSIIASNVSFGAGTITGNLRLDEKEIPVLIKGERINSQKNKLGSIIGSGTRIGTQCSINPGIKIGKNCFLGSSINVQNNIENNQFVVLKQEIVQKENKYTVDIHNRKSV